MARCVSLHHSARLSAARALAFHDEAILTLLQDDTRDLFPEEVRGISACSWEGRKKLHLVLAGCEAKSVRQVRITNTGSHDSIYFLGAALVPPLSAEIAEAELSDDFGVCSGVAAGVLAGGPAGEAGSLRGVSAPGAVACQLAPGSEYLVALSCALKSRPTNPAARRHLLVLAFHDSTARQTPGDPSEHAAPGAAQEQEFFHLFVSIQLDISLGLHAAPELHELRVSAPPFFPECLRYLFDTPPQWLQVATPSHEDASLMAFSSRYHMPACALLPQRCSRQVELETALICSDGFPVTAMPKHVHNLLQAVDEEECAMRVGITHFDMFYASLKSVAWLPVRERRNLGVHEGTPNMQELYTLVVPGLHEGKPPVFRGDAVHIRLQGYEELFELVCCALVVSHSALVVQVPEQASQYLSDSHRVHVRFSIDAMRLEAMRGAGQALLSRRSWSWWETELPRPPHGGLAEWKDQDCVLPFPARSGRWFGELNDEQRYVVEAVHAMPRGSPPLLLLGPPGTGKSWALAETVCQFLFCHAKAQCEALQQGRGGDEGIYPEVRVLLCAPTDIACDLLVETIHSHLQPQGGEAVFATGLLLRFNEPRRPYQQLQHRSAILQYCCIENGVFQYPSQEALMQASVVVCNLRAAWALHQYMHQYMHGSGVSFDYVLIDEAGQALELEAYAALALGAPNAIVLLAGDPKQLGPTCRAAHQGQGDALIELFRCSLLERLAERHPRWQSHDSLWAVRLHRNYRSHPAILGLLSALRYDGTLAACAAPELVNRFDRLDVLPNPGFPIVFMGVRGQQQMDLSNDNQHCLSRPDVAHSFHNPEECLAVTFLVQRLLASPGAGVTSDDIGIVCAFRRQVQKIRGRLRQLGLGAVRIGTVEDYQGQQERILIISTTLSDTSQAATLHELDGSKSAGESQEGQPAAGPAGEGGGRARADIATALQACIRARVQRDEAENGSAFPMERRQTSNLVGNVRRFTVALSRAQCLLFVVGCPEVLETSPHWRQFLLYVAAHGSLQGERPSQVLLLPAGATTQTPSTASEDRRPPRERQRAAPLDAHDRDSGARLAQAHEEIERLQSDANAKDRLLETYAGEVSMLASELRRCNVARDEALLRARDAERRRREDVEDRLCVVCSERRKNVAFLPCGHVAVCQTCVQLLIQSPDPQCPNCRGHIRQSCLVYV